MKEEELKKLLQQSELRTSADFTDRLMEQLSTAPQPAAPVRSWPLWQVLLGFVLFSGLILFTGVSLLKLNVLSGNLWLPVLTAFVLLLLLNQVIVLHRWRGEWQLPLPRSSSSVV